MVNFSFHGSKVKNPSSNLSRFEPIILFFEPIIFLILSDNGSMDGVAAWAGFAGWAFAAMFDHAVLHAFLILFQLDSV